MAKSIFQRYRELATRHNAPRDKENSLRWFRNRIRKDSPIRDLNKVTEGLRNARIEPGAMVTYVYDPKTKDKLPFYDMFPLIIILAPAKGGWYGVNLHYLPPVMRAELLLDIGYRRNSMDAIVKKLENNPMTKPALRRYLASHARTRMKLIPRDEWEIAINLPTENFQKAGNKQIWRTTRSKL